MIVHNAYHTSFSSPMYDLFPALQMWINMKPYTSQVHNRKATPYAMVVSDKNGQIDQKRNSILLKPGYKISVKVFPRLFETTSDFDGLTINQRECKLAHETKGFSLLKEYTQEGCEFECAVQKAVSVCKCLPWHYSNDFTKWPICEMFGGYCFDLIISDDAEYKKCKTQCLRNCKETVYMVLPGYVPLDVEPMCNMESLYYQHFQKSFKKHFSFHSYKTLVEGGSIPDLLTSFNNGSLCEHYVRDYVAFVSIDSPTTIIATGKDRRIFFIDQLGTVGGIGGLFLGMSVITFLELPMLLFSLINYCRIYFVDIFKHPNGKNNSDEPKKIQKERNNIKMQKLEYSVDVSNPCNSSQFLNIN